MSGLENRGETLIFVSRHFDEAMTILILHFLHFGAQKIQLVLILCLIRINKIHVGLISQTKNWMFYLFQYFPSTFPTAYFPHSFVQSGVQMAYG